jgi:hypothetical protein
MVLTLPLVTVESVFVVPLARAICADSFCEIGALMMHVNPDGIKVYGHDELTVFLGLLLQVCALAPDHGHCAHP